MTTAQLYLAIRRRWTAIRPSFAWQVAMKGEDYVLAILHSN